MGVKVLLMAVNQARGIFMEELRSQAEVIRKGSAAEGKLKVKEFVDGG